MNTPTIDIVFPTAVMRNNIGRDFTSKELQEIKKHSKKSYKNIGNTTSNNNYVLDEEVFTDLKQICLDHATEYLNVVYKPKYDVKPYITQSWFNWTKTGEFHHEHAHPNSFISGVLYINAGEEDKIKFFKSGYQQLKVQTDDYDMFNSDTWWFGIKNADIVLFPSSLVHMVETVAEQKTRVSLAFNTFLTGTFGDNKQLTELKI
jgi:uncharacterized protein (TIGR02466 family)